MGKINILSKATAEKIAAGEVVERPANAIKEMVENSIDAGAKSVCIEIRHGGISFIRITDDGGGILPEDAEKAFLRHATSKIKDEADLAHIATLGFRGEALCSIASVSKTEMTTKTPALPMGTHIVVEGGEIKVNEEMGCADGTTITVRDLFYNTPARMKFLKKDSAEAAVVTEVCQRQAFSHPDVSVRLIRDGKEVFFTPGNNSISDTVRSIWGRDISQNMGEVNYNSGGITVKGMAGKNNLFRPSRSMQVFFVNGRNVINRVMTLALADAYKNELMTGKFPVAVIDVEMNPSLCDVNVHPSKTEIKFADDKAIYNAVYWAVKNMLVREAGAREANPQFVRNTQSYKMLFTPEKKEQISITPSKFKQYTTPPIPKEAEIGKKKNESVVHQELDPFLPQKQIERLSEEQALRMKNRELTSPIVKSTGLFGKHEDSEKENTKLPLYEEAAKKPPKDEESVPIEKRAEEEKPPIEEELPLRIIGQLFSTYIIAEAEKELVLIDQHAAHERVRYEELKSGKQSVSMQMLMVPIETSLSAEEMAAVEENGEFLWKMGFDIEKIGENKVLIKSVPSDCFAAEGETLLCELAGILNGESQGEISDRRDRAMYTVACKGAIKANHELSQEELELLLKKALALEGISTCPHGRPISVKLTKYQIEKMFKRIV